MSRKRAQQCRESRKRSAAETVRPQEQLLIDALPDLAGDRILCNTVGRGQFAQDCAAALPSAQVECFFLDLYQMRQVREQELPGNLIPLCEADLPDHEQDAVAFAFRAQGEAELTRDLLQEGHQRLRLGGRLWAAVDNPRDAWLHDELRKLYPKVTRRPGRAGVLYVAAKQSPLKKTKDFTCRFAFRDGPRLIPLVTRPGVFGHRKLDLGARCLLEGMTVERGMRVLELGCGSGGVSLAAAQRASGVQVVAVDSNPRALDCLRQSAALNDLHNVETLLDDAGATLPERAFDLVLGNPPYFSRQRIAEIFVNAARRALKPGGRFQVVTKQPAWYAERLPVSFAQIEFQEIRGYTLVTCIQPAA